MLPRLTGKGEPAMAALEYALSPSPVVASGLVVWQRGTMSAPREDRIVPKAACTRRAVLQAAVAFPGVFAVPAGFAAAASGVLATPAFVSSTIDAFVVDRRFWPAGKALPEGMELHFVDGNANLLWYDQLDVRWRQPGYVLAGRSGEDVLFVLEQLAFGRGRRVTTRQAKDGIVSWVIAPR